MKLIWITKRFFPLAPAAFSRMSGSEGLRVLRLILPVKRVKFGFTIENAGWQEAPFKNFQTLNIDLKWFCLLSPDQFQFCFELQRIVRNSGISKCLLNISGTEPNPASNLGYAAMGEMIANETSTMYFSKKKAILCTKSRWLERLLKIL